MAAALDADTKEELGQQRDLGLQWRLERGRERGELSSAFAKRRAAHWMPSRRRGLRGAFVRFLGNTNAFYLFTMNGINKMRRDRLRRNS